MAPDEGRSPAPTTDPKTWPVRRAESFGGIVLRRHGDQTEVALIRTRNLKNEQVWALPKGVREEGEGAEDAALREVREETGLEARIVRHLDDVTYWFVPTKEQARYRKTVHLYLLAATGADTALNDDEVDEVRFLSVREAVRLATYPTDRKGPQLR